MDESYAKAKEVILSKREMLNKISTRLLEKETIESDEFKELINS
jgi:ATP-dependent Zn protease